MTQGPCACTTLRKAARAVTRFYDEALAAAGLTATQLAVLRAVDRLGTVAMSRVADALVMDRTSFYRAVAPLVRDGLLREGALAGDARAKSAALTPKGRARMDAAASAWEAAQDRMVARVGARQWRALSALLLEITEDVKTWIPEAS